MIRRPACHCKARPPRWHLANGRARAGRLHGLIVSSKDAKAQRRDEKNVRMIKTEVRSRESEVRKQGERFGNLRFHSTFDIIEAANAGKLPEQMMMTFHPQRWTDNPVEWMKELVWQNVKNVIKRAMLAYRDRK